MKKLILITFCCIIYLTAFSQVNFVKKWDHTYGGSDVDNLNSLIRTSDNGFLLGGDTRSDSSGDVTQHTQGVFDYWIVKTDSNGSKMWDKRFGGSFSERLHSVKQTYDGGYLLAGTTTSDSGSGDVTQPTRGIVDFWIVKTNASGNKLWDKRYGGNDVDEPFCIALTTDSGFIVGGYTSSAVTSEVTDISRGGLDFWILKADKNGVKQWDKRFGGNSTDEIHFLQQTADGGYILGGRTSSDSSGEVSQPSNGFNDFWIVKTDANGNKIWDKRFGGDNKDYFVALQQTTDHGYILGGYIYSDVSGDVSESTRDTSFSTGRRGDFWMVKIDSAGTKKWDKRFGGFWVEDAFGYISQTFDGGYIMAGSSYSGISGDKTESNFGYEQSWIIRTDSAGNKKWDKTIFTDSEDESAYPIQVSDSCFVIANGSKADSAGLKSESSRGNYDYWIFKICETQIPQLPIANFTASNSTNCAGGCFSFDNLSYDAGSFQWYFPGADDTSSNVASPGNVCYQDSGTYSVTLIAFNGSGSDTLTQTNVIHLLPLTPLDITERNDTLFATQGLTGYQWYFNGNQLQFDTNYFYVSSQSGEYVVIAQGANGCPSKDTISFVVGVSEYSEKGLEINVYPNPAHDEINVSGLSLSSDGELRIHNILGKKVFSSRLISGQMKINISNLIPGIYILDVNSNRQKYYLRFIKN